MLNNVVLIGRLTRDPELRYSTTGTAICNFTLAVDRPRQKDKENEADFIPIVCFKQTGEAAANALRKGHRTAVQGRIQTRSYENNEGRKIFVTEIIADNVRFLEPKQNGQSGGHAPSDYDSPPPVDDSDLPF
jgi:single-strand DNA-binding protein